MIKKRKVSFYKLTQEKHTYVKERNTTEIRNLDNTTIENNFKYIYDNKTNIDGEYVISKIIVPLAYNGTMSITATKAVENIV